MEAAPVENALAVHPIVSCSDRSPMRPHRSNIFLWKLYFYLS
jgi:hypothetical protein